MDELLSSLIDKRVLLYVLITGGISELAIQQTPDFISRKRFGFLICIVVALVTTLIDAAATEITYLQGLFRGLITAAIASWGYDVVKGMLKIKTPPPPGES